jgi:hypothetical protein
MDHDQILRELALLEIRISDAQERITYYRDKIKARKDSGRPAEFDTAMLRACESTLGLHLSLQEKLRQQLSRSAE